MQERRLSARGRGKLGRGERLREDGRSEEGEGMREDARREREGSMQERSTRRDWKREKKKTGKGRKR